MALPCDEVDCQSEGSCSSQSYHSPISSPIPSALSSNKYHKPGNNYGDKSEQSTTGKEKIIESVALSFDPSKCREFSCIRSSLATKANPREIKSWIGLSLTLDGRDKITKVLQYSSRLLGFYYESISASITKAAVSSANLDGESSTNAVGKLGLALLYRARSKRFRKLQKALTSSRKAYRLGRTITEIDKFRSMGVVHWLAWHFRQNIFERDEESYIEDEKGLESETKMKNLAKQETSGSLHQNETFVEKRNVVKFEESAAPTITLPRQVSSNLSPKLVIPKRRNAREYSAAGKLFHTSLSFFIDEQLTSKVAETPPFWKVLSSTCKLLGLAGFWAGDNISYLHSTGFLSDERRHHRQGNMLGSAKVASLFAARCYFFAAVSGLYMNFRDWYSHRNGALSKAIEELQMCRCRKEAIKIPENKSEGRSLDKPNVALEEFELQKQVKFLEEKLKNVEQKHAQICLALMKSCCDSIVFSNNAGIDLHLKYRGKKMSEGVQSVCGIISALTVLYNNFPKNL